MEDKPQRSTDDAPEGPSDDSPQRHADDAPQSPSNDSPRRHARRAALYAFVATAFQYPDDAVVRDLRDEDVQAAVREAAAALGLESEVETLTGALEETDAEGLEAAYNDLFGLPGDDGTYPVVPYEAEYTTGDEVNESQRRIATVVGLLEQFGLTVREAFDERQDHVAVELELLQVVAAQRAVALEDGEEETATRLARAGATVLDEHLADFVPAFAHRVHGEVDARTDADGCGTGAKRAAIQAYDAAATLAAELVRRDVARHPEPVDPRTEVEADG